MAVAFAVASFFAILMDRKRSLNEKIEIYSSGMGNSTIMTMCLIFILAGSFAAISKGMGAVDSAVAIARNFIPEQLMLPGIFLVACFISLAIGTSCGTIATLTAIAIGLGEGMGCSPALTLGAVIGGAMFGDNMSMISDTTIAATRTQGVLPHDKFFENLKVATPAVLITLLLYIILGHKGGQITDVPPITWKDYLLVTPYVLILVLSLCKWNVMALLFCGSILAGVIGILTGKQNMWEVLKQGGDGSINMAETLIVALLAGGLLSLLRCNGGILFVMNKVENHIKSTRGCELGISLLTAVVNLFTANNTVALVVTGPIANELSQKYSCKPSRIASIIDITSCIVQGLIPYGAQILIAIGIAKQFELNVSCIDLILHMYYQLFLAVCLILFILFWKEKKQQ